MLIVFRGEYYFGIVGMFPDKVLDWCNASGMSNIVVFGRDIACLCSNFLRQRIFVNVMATSS